LFVPKSITTLRSYSRSRRPTGAFVVIVYGIVQRYGIDGLVVATIMAGLILVVLVVFF
jgi:MFS superfamily sulfate permease-like transporter